jgi:hypothetical protein
MPEQFSELMATFFANFLPYLVLVWSISFWIFFARSRVLVEQREKLLDEEDGEIIPAGIFGFAFICICIPYRSCIGACFGGAAEANAENIKEYKDVALTFPSDYDKANPLTSVQGQVRLLDIQIENAQSTGNEEALKMLQE